MTSGLVLIAAGIWVILQTTKGGLPDRLGLGGGGTSLASTPAAPAASQTPPAASSSTLPPGLPTLPSGAVPGLA